MTSNIKREMVPTTDILEDIFDIEPGTSHKEVITVDEDVETVRPSTYDDKDSEIDGQYETVYRRALEAFEYQMDQADTDDVDPKVASAFNDSAASFLNMALQAAKAKAGLKQDKDKNALSKMRAGSGESKNTIVISHSDLLDMMEGENDDGPVYDHEDDA